MNTKSKAFTVLGAVLVMLAGMAGVSSASSDSLVARASSDVGALAYGPIHTRLNNRCLDADANTLPNNGTKVQLWDCNGTTQQGWGLQSLGNNWYFIHIQWSDKCLDADANAGGNGTKVQIWDCNNSRQQMWHLTVSGGTARFTNGLPGARCLDADANNGGNGTKVQLWDCNGSPQQGWW